MTQIKEVLVVDDEPQIRQVIASILGRRGHRVTGACDSKHGLEALRQTCYDLVITDILMPDQDGLEFIQAALKASPGVPIVAISGGGRIAGRDYLRIAKGLGARGVIEKPFDLEGLLAVLEPFLSAGEAVVAAPGLEAGGPREILVVDDEEQARELMTAVLQVKGHRVTCAANALLGLQELYKKRFDLAITDILMPDHDGMEFIREARKAFPDLPVVALSGGGGTPAAQYLEAAQSLGARAGLEKPFELDQLFATLQPLLSKA